MKIQVIASGSKGNITYFETPEGAFLIDAGIPVREFVSKCHGNLDAIEAIFITHEHSDHIRYLADYLDYFPDVRVYIGTKSAQALPELIKAELDETRIAVIKPDQVYYRNSLRFIALELPHDSVACFGYIFVYQGKGFGYLTDLGLIPNYYLTALQKVSLLVLEANHDVSMLNESDRPWFLKRRILSVKGHLSNDDARFYVEEIIKGKLLQTVILAHVSEECNTPELLAETFGDLAVEVHYAKQHEPLPMIKVGKRHGI